MARRPDEIGLWSRKRNFAILLFLILYVAARTVLYVYDHLSDATSFLAYVPRELLLILAGLPAIFITLFFANIVSRIVGPRITGFFKDELEPEQRIFFAKAFEFLVYGCAVAFILYTFGATWNSIALILGFISGGLAFALREPVLSLILWVVTLRQQPFRLGDTIRIGEYEGTVHRIGVFYVTLKPGYKIRADAEVVGMTVQVPNRKLIEHHIENYGTTARHIVRMQIKLRPPSIARLLKETEEIVTRILKRHRLPRDVEVGTDIHEGRAIDKNYVVITLVLPLNQKEELRSEIITAMYEKHKKYYLP